MGVFLDPPSFLEVFAFFFGGGEVPEYLIFVGGTFWGKRVELSYVIIFGGGGSSQ